MRKSPRKEASDTTGRGQGRVGALAGQRGGVVFADSCMWEWEDGSFFECRQCGTIGFLVSSQYVFSSSIIMGYYGFMDLSSIRDHLK